jgi:hypothetical protein
MTHRTPVTHPSAAERAADRWRPLEEHHCAGCRCFHRQAALPEPPPVVWAPVLAFGPSANTRVIQVGCPFCGDRHVHGFPWGSVEKVTAWAAHCPGGGDYRVKLPGGVHRLVRPGSPGGAA